jgi:hypothetical protein
MATLPAYVPLLLLRMVPNCYGYDFKAKEEAILLRIMIDRAPSR